MKPKKIERGQIWWINLDPSVGAEIRKERPCVVLSNNTVNRVRRTPVVVPLSASPESAPPVVVPVPSAGKDSVAVIDQIRAVDKSRFTRSSGRVSETDLELIANSVLEMLDLLG